MANLVEGVDWVDGIYQIETTDPVLGGPTGIMNQQAKQLAARTAYLRKTGISEWDAAVAYPSNAYVQDAGKTWKAKTASTNKKPSTNAANWLEWGLDLEALNNRYATLASPAFSGSPSTPTPPQFDNDQSIANMAALQAAGLHFQGKMGVGISGNVTLGPEHAGHWFEVKKAGAIVGLPSVAALPSGLLTYTFKSLVDWTLQAAPGEAISAVGGAVENILAVKAGESLTVVCNGAGQPWYVVIAGFSLATLETTLANKKLAPLNSPIFVGDPQAPTPSQFDNDQSIATMAALQAAGLHFKADSGLIVENDLALTLAMAGHWLEIKKPNALISLPPLAQCPPGLVSYTFRSFSNWTLKANGADQISSAPDGGLGAQISVSAGEYLTIVSSGGGYWFVVSAGFRIPTLNKLIGNRPTINEYPALAVNYNASMLRISGAAPQQVPMGMQLNAGGNFFDKFSLNIIPVLSGVDPNTRPLVVRELLQYMGCDRQNFSAIFNIVELTIKNTANGFGPYAFTIPYRHMKSGACHSFIIYHKLIGQSSWSWLNNTVRDKWNQATSIAFTPGDAGGYVHIDMMVSNAAVGDKLYFALPQIVLGKWDAEQRIPQLFNIWDMIVDAVPSALPTNQIG